MSFATRLCWAKANTNHCFSVSSAVQIRRSVIMNVWTLRKATMIKSVKQWMQQIFRNVLRTWMWLIHGSFSKTRLCLQLMPVYLILRLEESKSPSGWTVPTVEAQLETKKEAYKHYLQTRSDSDYNLYARAWNQAKKVCRTTAVKNSKKILLNMQKRIRKPSFCMLV